MISWCVQPGGCNDCGRVAGGPRDLSSGQSSQKRTAPSGRASCVLAGEKGFEPLHAGIKIQCLNQLGDSPTRVDGLRHQPIYVASNRPAIQSFSFLNRPAAQRMDGQIAALPELPTFRSFREGRQRRFLRQCCKHGASGASHSRCEPLATKPVDGFGDVGAELLSNRLQVVVAEVEDFSSAICSKARDYSSGCGALQIG